MHDPRRPPCRKGREAKRAAQGRCEGRKPYGQGEREQRVVATVKALRRKPRGDRPRSYQRIADILNANGIPPRAGAKWHASSVRNVCRGAAYRAARVGDALAISLSD